MSKKNETALENDMLTELKKIRQLLEPKPASPDPIPPKGFVNEFKSFLSTYKVLGITVAFILGIYLGALVQALVNDLVMPIVSLVIPNVQWEAITAGPFRIGHFVGSAITFIIVAIVIFMLVKITKKLGIE